MGALPLLAPANPDPVGCSIDSLTIETCRAGRRSRSTLKARPGRMSVGNAAQRQIQVAAALASGDPDAPPYPARVCALSVGFLGMSGAGLTLIGNGQPAALWASDGVAKALEQAQLTLGEGPSVDAYASGAPVLEPFLATSMWRWPFFGPAAMRLGVGALFSFPLQVGAIRLGVLDLARSEPGHLSDDQLASALTVADVATADLVQLHADGEIPWATSDLRHRARVHQATGMVAAQLGCSMAVALARLRAHAFSSGNTIYDVAEDVLTRRMRFE